MKCSICGTAAADGAERCPTCGCRFRTQYSRPFSPFDPDYVRPAKKKKTWLWVLIPVALVILLTIAGIVAAVLTLLDHADEITDLIPDATISAQPDQETPTIVPPYYDDPVSEDCFTLVEGTLLFLPEAYDGGPVLQIPDTIGGQTVTAIGAGCFSGCDGITTILLPDTVTGIHPNAFAGCSKLRGLFLPEGTEFIGKDAFGGCVDLEAIYIPASVSSIEPGVFDDCASLMYIFYGGMHEDWEQLYDSYITPYTYVLCLDGEYYQVAE